MPCSLKYTILEKQSEALAFAEETTWGSAATIKKHSGYGTLQDACKALADKHADRFGTALDALLDEHKMKVSHGTAKLPDEIVCFPAAALLILARKQGLALHVTSSFIPAALLD